MKIYRQEYPRPELKRENWLCLNGEWDFGYDYGVNGFTEDIVDLWKREEAVVDSKVAKLPLKINVPFCPESKLSGIENREFFNACWYKRTVEIPSTWTGRVLLNFEASFYHTRVLVNGTMVGSHKGGYTPFSFDITDCIKDGKATIVVHVQGDARDMKQPSGKQAATYSSVGCFYTRTTGIWQTVWLENVPNVYVKTVHATPDVDNDKVYFDVKFSNVGEKEVDFTVLFDGEEISTAKSKTTTDSVKAVLDVKDAKLWSIETPNLYDVKISVKQGESIDNVTSYFGMRKVEWANGELRLNGKKVFQRLVLDQGYYIDGIYTAPTVEDLKKDIEISKAVGFNGARLHQKVFERNFLYLADKMGYLCWGEYASWGFDYTKDENTNIFIKEWLEAVERDYSHPSIIGWIPMNENWEIKKIFQSNEMVKAVYYATKLADKTRPVIDVSWNYHVVTDVFDTHDYDQNTQTFDEHYRKFNDGEGYDQFKQVYEGQPYFLSEYGGFTYDPTGNGWGYGDAPKSSTEYVDRYVKMSDTLHANPRISAICYTQLYDVEQEQNGIYNYDRSVKFTKEEMDALKKAMEKVAEYEKE